METANSKNDFTESSIRHQAGTKAWFLEESAKFWKNEGETTRSVVRIGKAPLKYNSAQY